MTVSSAIVSPLIACFGVTRLHRDLSFQSECSQCSSVESLLELRRADPEEILLSLGFGGCSSVTQDRGLLSRIPKRFLQPSSLNGITINDFVKQQHESSESLDTASLGYRGLTGSPHVIPSEIVQKIVKRLREQDSQELDSYCYNKSDNINEPYAQDHFKLSVLSPDDRQYLNTPRARSPDIPRKRMIIGQRSFTFGHDGDLIELKPKIKQTSNREIDNLTKDYQIPNLSNLMKKSFLKTKAYKNEKSCEECSYQDCGHNRNKVFINTKKSAEKLNITYKNKNILKRQAHIEITDDSFDTFESSKIKLLLEHN